MKVFQSTRKIHFKRLMKRRLSIRASFTLPFFIQSILITFLLGILIYRGSLEMAENMIEQINLKILEEVKAKLVEELDKPIQINDMNANVIENGLINIQEAADRDRYFTSLLKVNGQLAMSYIGMTDGSFYGARRTADGKLQVVVNNETTSGNSNYYGTDKDGRATFIEEVYKQYDPRKRPWYQKATKENRSILTDVYEHFVFKELTITAARPVYKDGIFIGIVGSDYLLSWLEKSLSKFPVGNSGVVYLVDENDYLVGTSMKIALTKAADGKSERIKVSELSTPIIKETYALAQRDKKINAKTIKIAGEAYVANYEDVKASGLVWHVVVVTAKKDFLAPLQLAIERVILVCLISMLIYFVLSYSIARHVSRPIESLNEAAKALAIGRGYAVDDMGRQDEIGQLIRSFNNMRRDLNKTVIELEKEVASRTKELQIKNGILEQLSYLDGLTGIANRRKFDVYLNESWKHASRENNVLGLLMIDIDYFKAYNDTYGHLEGDRCLRDIAQTLATFIRREEDLLARYGGEEFVVILNHTEPHYGEVLATQLIESIRALNKTHEGSPWGVVTISIGVAMVTPKAYKEVQGLIQLADEALYEAKSSGRNKYCVTKVQ